MTGPDTQAQLFKTGPDTQAKLLRTCPETQAKLSKAGPDTPAKLSLAGPEAQLCMAGWGLPECSVDSYREKGIVEMFPWQASALLCGGGSPLAGGNLVYSAPTSAGKTLVAEVLMMKVRHQ
jgi:DNA polymerase theta